MLVPTGRRALWQDFGRGWWRGPSPGRDLEQLLKLLGCVGCAAPGRNRLLGAACWGGGCDWLRGAGDLVSRSAGTAQRVSGVGWAARGGSCRPQRCPGGPGWRRGGEDRAAGLRGGLRAGLRVGSSGGVESEIELPFAALQTHVQDIPDRCERLSSPSAMHSSRVWPAEGPAPTVSWSAWQC